LAALAALTTASTEACPSRNILKRLEKESIRCEMISFRGVDG